MYSFPDLEPVWNHWLEPVWNAYSMFHSNWAYTNNLNQEVKDNITSITRHVDIIILAAAAAAKSLQSCPTLCDAIDGSPPGSPVPGILQARTLEWAMDP